MDDPVGACLAGLISPQVALARLVLAGTAQTAIRAEAGRRGAAGMLALLDSHAAGLDRLAALSADVDHAHADVEAVRALFDRAAAHSPEASVAAYSLGDPAMLEAATAELIRWLSDCDLLTPESDVLDLGCGIGRIAAALAPRVRSVLGLDVSAIMVAEARRRVPGVRFATTPGHDLAALPDQAFDLIVAVDSMPYLMQAAVADAHVADVARVLRPGGALVILNLSYRDLAADLATANRWAAAYGFTLEREGERPFTLWDGTAFLLRLPRR